jgi:hypothetical protein
MMTTTSSNHRPEVDLCRFSWVKQVLTLLTAAEESNERRRRRRQQKKNSYLLEASSPPSVVADDKGCQVICYFGKTFLRAVFASTNIKQLHMHVAQYTRLQVHE